MTTAFVLSGGGNRGPVEVGALQSLLEHDIRPDFIVGTSAGSINSVFLASRGADLTAIPALSAAWHKATASVAYPGGALSAMWRVVRGRNSLFSSDGLRGLIQDNLPPGVITFGDLRCPLYTTATDLRSRRLYLFGEDRSAPLVEAVLASASMPGIHPPVPYHDLQLVDGGIIATTPVGIAIEKGANVIYALNLGGDEQVQPPVQGIPKNLRARSTSLCCNRSSRSRPRHRGHEGRPVYDHARCVHQRGVQRLQQDRRDDPRGQGDHGQVSDRAAGPQPGG